MHKRFIFAVIIFFASVMMTTAQTEYVINSSWVSGFTPVRELYVSPTGTGTGSSSSPMSLKTAMESAKPGDLYWIRGGTYSGRLTFQAKGTAANPIVFRAYPGEHVVLQGKMLIYGDHTWIWGWDITDPIKIADDAAVALYAPGVHLINNYIHDHKDTNGVGAWNSGAGQVLYGNIIRRNGYDPSLLADGSRYRHPHNVYTQNSFVDSGYKYFVNNIIMEAGCGDCFNFHAYTENDIVTGFYMERNIIANGDKLIGGYGVPSDNHVINQNYYHNSRVQFGYRRPTQASFTYNYLNNSTLWTEYFWGANEQRYTQPGPNVFSGNTFIGTNDGNMIRFRTSSYAADETRNEGTPAIKGTDVFDYNTYTDDFSANFYANGNNAGSNNFTQWKQNAAAAGNAFDVNSTLIAKPTQAAVFVLPNEYEAGRAHIAVYNHGNASQVSVDLSAVLSNGSNYTIYNANNVFGTPAAQGTYNGAVSLNVSGQAFSAFLVIGGNVSTTPDPVIVPPTPEPTPQPKPPASGLNSDTNSSTLPIRPAFDWQLAETPEDTANSWHNLIIYNWETQSIVADKWYRHSTICNGTGCSVATDAEVLPYGLINGRHGWWIRSYIDGAMTDYAEGGEFTINVNAPNKPTNLEGTFASNRVTINWAHDANALYYQVYVGQPDAGKLTYFSWITREDANCGSTCELEVEVTRGTGEYSIYIQAWGPGGYNGNRMEEWEGPQNFSSQ